MHKAINWGGGASLFVNLLFFLFTGSGQPKSFWQFIVCVGIPMAVLILLAPVIFLIVNLLKGGKLMTQWNSDDAKEILRTSRSKLQIRMARAYLILIWPIGFFLGWFVVSAIFHNVYK
jgi:hypothetical protein